MNNTIKKITLLLVIVFILTVAIMGYVRLSTILKTIDNVSSANTTLLKQHELNQQQLTDIEKSINTLKQHSNTFEQRINQLEENTQTFALRLDVPESTTLQKQLDNVKNEVSHLKQLSVHWEIDFNALKEKVNQYIRTLKQPSVLPQSSSSKIRPAFPYQMIATEQRGSQLFITIAPKDYQNIADVRLLRQGETIGIWTLAHLSHHAVIFQSGQYQHKVSW